MPIELKPCPFCGCSYGKDPEDYVYAGKHAEWCVLGSESGLGGALVVPDIPRYIEAWNRRADDATD